MFPQATHVKSDVNSTSQDLFDFAPIAFWEADVAELQKWFADLQAAGVTCVRSLLESDMQQVPHALSLMTIRRVNSASIAMFQARDAPHLLDNVAPILASMRSDVLIDLLMASCDGRRSFRADTPMTTLHGKQLRSLLSMSMPEDSGQADPSRTILAFSDITECNCEDDWVMETPENEHDGLLRLAEEAGNIGSFEYNIVTGHARGVV